MAPKQQKNINKVEALTERFTVWVGSTTSIAVHTVVFIGAFVLVLFGANFNSVLLILTTAVSLEAIYLALFIQMSVNKNTQSLAEVEEDIDEIQEDVEGIEKDIDEIQEDVEEMQEDVEEIEKDGDEDDLHDAETMKTLTQLQTDMKKLMDDLQALKEQKK